MLCDIEFAPMHTFELSCGCKFCAVIFSPYKIWECPWKILWSQRKSQNCVGAESSVDRLMKQIATFVSEISDEFKVVVVQAIKSLALKFPRKHGILMNFLSSMLRDEGGLVSYRMFLHDFCDLK